MSVWWVIQGMRRIGAWRGVAGRGGIDEAQVFRLLEVRRREEGEGRLIGGMGLRMMRGDS